MNSKKGDRPKATILIIEDEEPLRTLYKAEFEEEGHNVLTAAKGATGLAQILDGRVDLVILDLSLPDMPGIDLLRAALEEIPDLPVIINSTFPLHLSIRSKRRSFSSRPSSRKALGGCPKRRRK